MKELKTKYLKNKGKGGKKEEGVGLV